MKITVKNLSRFKGLTPEMFPHLLELAEEKDWFRYFLFVSTPFRFDMLRAVQENLNDIEFWGSFREIWMHAENLWEDWENIEKLLELNRPQRESIMDAKERAALKKLPTSIQIFRGGLTENLDGYSWTLSKEKAEWFAKCRQQQDNAFSFEGECQKDDVLALFLERDEDEILIAPKKVKLLKQIQVKVNGIHAAHIHTKKYALDSLQMSAMQPKNMGKSVSPPDYKFVYEKVRQDVF